MAQKLFSDFPASVSSMPGMVTPNITADVGTRMDPATQRMMLQRQWDIEDRKWQLGEERRRKQEAINESKQEEGEQEGKIRSAYEKIYGPYLQSQWDVSQGQFGGVGPRMISGDPRLGSVYKKQGMGIATGQQPFVYRRDTNMPAGQYGQQMQQGYDMWRAMKLLGMDKEKFGATGGRGGGGGSKAAGATWSGPAGMEMPKQYRE